MVRGTPRPCTGKQVVVGRLIYTLIIALLFWPFPYLSYHQHFLCLGTESGVGSEYLCFLFCFSLPNPRHNRDILFDQVFLVYLFMGWA